MPPLRSKDPMGLILAAARVDPHLMQAARELDKDRQDAAHLIEMLSYRCGDMANIVAAAINWRNGLAYKMTADHPTSMWLAELLDAWDYDAIIRDETGAVMDIGTQRVDLKKVGIAPCIPRCAGCTACAVRGEVVR